MKKIAGVVAGVGALLMLSSSAFALEITTAYFNNITNNSNINVASQLSVDIKELSVGGDQVNFVFHNAGLNDASITDVYFEDGTLLGIAAIINTNGVAFSQYASPSNPPGGNTVGFTTHAGFSADSDSPTAPNGVNPNEELTITFNLIFGQTYSDTVAALNSGKLRIALHVQSIDGVTPGQGYSDSDTFVNKVPEPGTLLILGGCLAMGLVYRRKLQD